MSTPAGTTTGCGGPGDRLDQPAVSPAATACSSAGTPLGPPGDRRRHCISCREATRRVSKCQTEVTYLPSSATGCQERRCREDQQNALDDEADDAEWFGP